MCWRLDGSVSEHANDDWLGLRSLVTEQIGEHMAQVMEPFPLMANLVQLGGLFYQAEGNRIGVFASRIGSSA
jgi:hypothetical protein